MYTPQIFFSNVKGLLPSITLLVVYLFHTLTPTLFPI